MNLPDIKHIVEHLIKTSGCTTCQAKFTKNDINVIATTGMEGLFEMKCKKCKASQIANVVMTSRDNTNKGEAFRHLSRKHQKITKDDILDVKNFLHNFDGNFKKIFSKKK